MNLKHNFIIIKEVGLSALPSLTDSCIFLCNTGPIPETVMKVRVNRFVHIGCLVARMLLTLSKWILHINDPFTDLSYMVYMLQYDSTHSKL